MKAILDAIIDKVNTIIGTQIRVQEYIGINNSNSDKTISFRVENLDSKFDTDGKLKNKYEPKQIEW